MAKAMLTISSDITISRGSASAITSFVCASRTSLMMMDWLVLCCNSSIQVLWVLPAGRICTALASIYGSLFDCHKTKPTRQWSSCSQNPWRPLIALDPRGVERLKINCELEEIHSQTLLMLSLMLVRSSSLYTWAFRVRDTSLNQAYKQLFRCCCDGYHEECIKQVLGQNQSLGMSIDWALVLCTPSILQLVIWSPLLSTIPHLKSHFEYGHFVLAQTIKSLRIE